MNELHHEREVSLLQVSIGMSQTTRAEKTMQSSQVVVIDAKSFNDESPLRVVRLPANGRELVPLDLAYRIVLVID